MGQNFFNCKRISGGQIAKICNNAILGIQMVSIAEGNILGERLGIDLKTLNDVFEVKKCVTKGFDCEVLFDGDL